MNKPNSKNILKFVPKKYLSENKVFLVSVRGYFLDTMGEKAKNDRGIYDDAIAIVSPRGVVTFNANTDPAKYKKGIANLNKGTWLYKIGIHGLSKPKALQYTALVQADKVTVHRDEQGNDTGWFGINIHKGGANSVSSIGCQTIPPSQWEAFISLVKSLMKEYGQKTIEYCLVENNPELNKKSDVNETKDVVFKVPKLAWDNKLGDKVSEHLFNTIKNNLEILNKAKDFNLLNSSSNLSDYQKICIWCHFFVAVAKFESSYNPKSYSVDVGTKNDKGSWSVGLYQMSANDSSAKKFNATFESLQDPIVNINVSVEQMTKQIKNSGLIFLPNNSKYRYWAVLLVGNKYSKIKQIISETKKNITT